MGEFQRRTVKNLRRTSCVFPADTEISSSSSRNRVTGVYEVSLCNLADIGSPGERLHTATVMNQTGTFV